MRDDENDRACGGRYCLVADPAGIGSVRFTSPQAHRTHFLQRGQILRREVLSAGSRDVRCNHGATDVQIERALRCLASNETAETDRPRAYTD